MTTIQDANEIDPPPKGNQLADDGEGEDDYDPEKAELQPFSFYMRHENMHEIL